MHFAWSYIYVEITILQELKGIYYYTEFISDTISSSVEKICAQQAKEL